MALAWDASDPNAGKPRADTGVVPGLLYIWARGNPSGTALACMLGKNPPKVIRGYGGWETIKRRGRRAVATYAGSETPAFQIEVILENRRVHTSDGAAGKMRRLERLAGGFDADQDPPPVVQWAANSPHHDYSRAAQNEWVCESFDWGELTYTDRATLIRAEATFVLGLYESPKVSGLQTAQAFPRAELKVGWDLRDFARHYCGGDPKRWKDVAELNRDDPHCPQSPSFKPARAAWLLVPPREDKAARERR